MNVYTLTGKEIHLKEPALKSGGEGAIYEIIGYPKKVAKIYHDLSDARSRENKIKEMVKISEGYSFKSASITQHIAWPLSPLFDKSKHFVGFGMNRISASTELDDLYVYPPQQNVNITIKNRIDCLISLCDVIEALHGIGQVFGDFNPNNIKIKSDWSVNFVDADSYHINSAGKEYRCVVCAPGYVAPEVIKACKGTTYANCRSQTFTKETDNFALAIHCFRMLMNGCHPFICQRQLKRAGSAPAPKPTDMRVEFGETPFFRNIPNYTTPDYAPDINSLPPYIRDLFKKAFVDGHANPQTRPEAAEWKRALEKFKNELTACKCNHAHYYWKVNSSCPYCVADQRHSKKFGNGMIVNTSKTISQSFNQTNTTIVSMQTAASSTSKTKGISKISSSFGFWSITIIISIIMLALLGVYVLPPLYDAIVGKEIVTMIGCIGGCIAGLVGTIIYNSCWTPNRGGGPYRWYEYILSVLTALGFTFGFGIALGLICLIAIVLFYIVDIAIAVAIFVAIFSGG